jgi:hypothetical protein
MKFSFKSFVIGFACAALSLGAVTYVNAASNATLKACANKTTGIMRYISKGSCKKTEKALSWNQTGPQGAAGVAGTNGQNFHVIDAAGRDLGPTIGLWNQGQTATILYEGGLWEVSSLNNLLEGSLQLEGLFSDSSCSVPLVQVREKMQSMARGLIGGDNPRNFKLAGESFLMSSKVVYKVIRSQNPPYTYPCTASTDPYFATYHNDNPYNPDLRLSAITEVSPPAYTAPFTIVAK